MPSTFRLTAGLPISVKSLLLTPRTEIFTPELPSVALPSCRLGTSPLRPRTSVMPLRVSSSWPTAVTETGVRKSDVEWRVAVTRTSAIASPVFCRGVAACAASCARAGMAMQALATAALISVLCGFSRDIRCSWYEMKNDGPRSSAVRTSPGGVEIRVGPMRPGCASGGSCDRKPRTRGSGRSTATASSKRCAKCSGRPDGRTAAAAPRRRRSP